MINDLAIVNRAINNVMDKYITDNKYQDHVVFQCKVMFQAHDVMFTMMMKEGLLKVQPFKAVFPASFLENCEEDEVVNLICSMFISVIKQCEKLSEKEELTISTTLTK